MTGYTEASCICKCVITVKKAKKERNAHQKSGPEDHWHELEQSAAQNNERHQGVTQCALCVHVIATFRASDIECALVEDHEDTVNIHQFTGCCYRKAAQSDHDCLTGERR